MESVDQTFVLFVFVELTCAQRLIQELLKRCPDPKYISRDNKLDEHGSEEEQSKEFLAETLKNSNYDVFLYDLKLLSGLPLLSE